MRILGFIFCLVIATSSAYGQDNGSNQSTSLTGGRWEFFMSEIAIRLTFKIDKFTGDVLQLTVKEDQSYTWVVLKKEQSSKDVRKPDTINYQLFSSGQAPRHTYLLNTNTGLSWMLVSDSGIVIFF